MAQFSPEPYLTVEQRQFFRDLESGQLRHTADLTIEAYGSTASIKVHKFLLLLRCVKEELKWKDDSVLLLDKSWGRCLEELKTCVYQGKIPVKHAILVKMLWEHLGLA